MEVPSGHRGHFDEQVRVENRRLGLSLGKRTPRHFDALQYGEPEPGKHLFIRTREQVNGWKSVGKDYSGVVAGKSEVRSPNGG